MSHIKEQLLTNEENPNGYDVWEVSKDYDIPDVRPLDDLSDWEGVPCDLDWEGTLN